MKTTFRKAVHALILLAPVMLIAPCASAQTPPRSSNAQQIEVPNIDRFTGAPEGPIEPGSEVRFTVRGAPGGVAALNIPDVAQAVAMEEIRPGVYRTLYRVRMQDDPDAFSSATATLQLDGQSVTANLSEPFAVAVVPMPAEPLHRIVMGAAPAEQQTAEADRR
jgi:hypothetical protein